MATPLFGVRGELISSPENLIFIDDACARMEALACEMPGSVSLIYMDPPFMTGKKFEARLKLGQERLSVESYSDKMSREEYLGFIKSLLLSSKKLLTEDGLIFIHVDYRAHAHIRLLADEIFGEDRFLNEIVWAYESGGRSIRSFSRKHDIILLYALSDKYDLHIADAATIQRGDRQNHMARGVDEDGRSYRHITVQGKTYRYYDDEAVPPTDVWTDIGHLQQKDPQRSGFETQKPLKLLDRIIRSASREGDIVLDPCFGSGTTLEAARALGRRFIGIDCNPLCLELARPRIGDAPCLITCPESEYKAEIEAERVRGITFETVYLNSFMPMDGPEGLDAVSSWAVGYVKDGIFHELAGESRSRKKGKLKNELRLPMDAGEAVIRVSDILGRRFFCKL